MGDALCLKFTDPTFLDAQDVTGGAVFLRFTASWVVLRAHTEAPLGADGRPPFACVGRSVALASLTTVTFASWTKTVKHGRGGTARGP